MKKFRVVFQMNGNKFEETVEADGWGTTTDGRLIFDVEDEKVAEYNSGQWSNVREVK